MEIRQETKVDIEGIHKVNCEAFDTNAEAKIVDALRDSGHLELSLIAVEDGMVIGHIAYSPMHFENPQSSLKVMALAPMAVAPNYQKKGVGSKLVKASIEELKKRNVDLVFLIGYPEYYPKFGFKPAFTTLGVKSNFEGVPDEAFMVLNLSENDFDLKTTKVFFRSEFSESL